MSEYQVIARKWRPQTFADVVGQGHVVRTLKNAIRSGRTAHAYLFVGPRGIGKTTLARIFAKALNCEHPKDGEPCGECASCREIAAERSLDVMEVDAASRNSTGDMRELADNTLTRPVSGRYKIYIIDEVHMLSKAAWNVLLKTVEEPPEHVKFIFATTEVHQVLPTIISRCQRFDLQPIPTRLIAERLQLIADTEHVAITPDAIAAIARAAEGGMRDAQSLLDQMIAFFASGDGSRITGGQVLSLFGLTDREDLLAILGAMLANDPAAVVTRVGALAKKGKNLETLFDDLLAALRAVQMCAILPHPEEILDESPENLTQYREMAGRVPAETLQILLETVSPVGRILHDALNKQIFLETILLKAMREAHAVRIGDILARLNQLRGAGELRFVEQVPAVEKNIAVPPPPPPVPAAPPAAALPIVPVSPPPVPDAPSDAAPEVEEAATEEIAAVPAEDVPAETAADGNDDGDEPASEDEVPAPEMPPLPMSAVAGGGGAGGERQSDKRDFSPRTDKTLRSIANENPQALTEIAETNPAVHEVVDLFSGKVIDIHQ